MKNFILCIIFTIGFYMAHAQNDGNKKTAVNTSFEVKGVCDMCKKRIEAAAIYTKGVRFAEWDKHAQKITVVYNSKRTTEEKIHQSIASTGHDTSKTRAEEKVYAKLPGCCRYRDGVEVH
jgi:periplasmic mercuric ion binding protein